MGTAGREPSPRRATDSVDYAELRASAEFRLLRKRYLRAGLVVTGCFLGWYLLYVVMSVFERDVMSHRLTGRIDVALVFGVLQIVVAFVLTWCYARYVRRSIEPLAERIRSRAARGPVADERPYVPQPRHHADGPPDGFFDDLFGDFGDFGDDPRGSQGGSR